ncbi:MAG: AMP-binding protein, partial [Solirubrobacterales bacterium]|nr:AMP-binding protein [Solirubrobacterales bacterium]
GARIMIAAMNSPMAVAAHLGAMTAGMIVVPMDMGSSAEFLASVAAKTEATLLLTSRSTLQVEGVRTISLADIDLARAEPFRDHHPVADDIAEIVFTSGTTGEPKGTVLSHGNVATDVRAAGVIVPDHVPLHLLSILPLSHMLEQTAGLYLPMLHGGSVHYVPSLQPPVILRELRRRRATGMVVVPRFLDMMLATIT